MVAERNCSYNDEQFAHYDFSRIKYQTKYIPKKKKTSTKINEPSSVSHSETKYVVLFKSIRSRESQNRVPGISSSTS